LWLGRSGRSIPGVEDGTLTIRGEKKYEREENEKGQYRMERSYGSFERAIPLPVEVDGAKAKAEFKNRSVAINPTETSRSAIATEKDSGQIEGNPAQTVSWKNP
jgi:HSP20 family protein